MAKTPTRFSVRKVKCCYCNSVIAGNSIVKSFEWFAVYDKSWKYDKFGGLSLLSNILRNKNNSMKFRRICDTEAKAKQIADEMNSLWSVCGKPEMIEFSKWGDVFVVKTERICPWKPKEV